MPEIHSREAVGLQLLLDGVRCCATNIRPPVAKLRDMVTILVRHRHEWRKATLEPVERRQIVLVIDYRAGFPRVALWLAVECVVSALIFWGFSALLP